MQPKLLKVVEEKKFRRMGDVRDRLVDVRLIAATHQDLRALIETKTFRSDLYFRISTVPLAIPPLRARQEDIPHIARTLLQRICSDMARAPVELSTKALERLRSYYWPGNIRELRNVIRTSLLLNEVVLNPPTLVRGGQLPRRTPIPTLTGRLKKWSSTTSPQVFRKIVAWKNREALGIAKSTLYQKLKGSASASSGFVFSRSIRLRCSKAKLQSSVKMAASSLLKPHSSAYQQIISRSQFGRVVPFHHQLKNFIFYSNK